MTRPRAALAVLVVVVACRRDPGRSTTVELWAMGREGEAVAEVLPEFERRHPGVHVRVQQIPWSAAHEKLLTAHVGGALPDVFQAGNTWLPELVAVDALERLDDRPIARDDYFPGILDTNVIDGATWGVPWYVDTRLLFYRTDALPAPPRTWTEWETAMERVKERAGADGYAILLPLREWQMPVILALQRGADLLRERDCRGNFEAAPFRDAFAFYLGLFRRGLAPRAGDTSVTNVYQDFTRGWFAIYPSGPWNLGEFARRVPASVPWSTAAMPAPDDQYPGVSLAGGASLAVARRSTRKASAWALVEYLSEPAVQVEFHRLTGDLPARRSAWRAPALAGDERAQAFWLQLQYTRSTPKIPEWERIASKVTQYAEAAIREDMTVDEALAGLDHDVDAVLEKRRWLVERGR